MTVHDHVALDLVLSAKNRPWLVPVKRDGAQFAKVVLFGDEADPNRPSLINVAAQAA